MVFCLVDFDCYGLAHAFPALMVEGYGYVAVATTAAPPPNRLLLSTKAWVVKASELAFAQVAGSLMFACVPYYEQHLSAPPTRARPLQSNLLRHPPLGFSLHEY